MACAVLVRRTAALLPRRALWHLEGVTAAETYAACSKYYDAIYHWKDYGAESERLHALLQAEGVPDGARILEAACGTGTHLSHLRRWYQPSGFDGSPSMLEQARAKLPPEVELWLADMASFSVATPYSALLCLFSSIGYLHGEASLSAAARCFAQALVPGGILILEPWLRQEAFVAGTATLHTYSGEEVKLSRLGISRKEGELSVVDLHWLVAERGATEVQHHVEHHELWMCPTATLLSVFGDAGFEVRFDPNGLMKDRGLLIGRRR